MEVLTVTLGRIDRLGFAGAAAQLTIKMTRPEAASKDVAKAVAMPAKQIPAASSEIVKLIRKLRWVGLEEKAELLAKEVEQQPATDTVLAIQSETD